MYILKETQTYHLKLYIIKPAFHQKIQLINWIPTKQSDDGTPEKDNLCVTSGSRIKWKKKKKECVHNSKQLEAGKQNPT